MIRVNGQLLKSNTDARFVIDFHTTKTPGALAISISTYPANKPPLTLPCTIRLDDLPVIQRILQGEDMPDDVMEEAGEVVGDKISLSFPEEKKKRKKKRRKTPTSPGVTPSGLISLE